MWKSIERVHELLQYRGPYQNTRSKVDGSPLSYASSSKPSNDMTTKFFVCAMHYDVRKKDTDADSIRLHSMFMTTNVSHVFSIAHLSGRNPGYAMGDFSDNIPYMSEMKPDIIALDYNWSQLEYVRNPQRYNTNWFVGKIHTAMETSDAEVFLLPNFIIVGDPKNNYMYDLFSGNGKKALALDYDVESFEMFNASQKNFKLNVFTISREESKIYHPLVKATVSAQSKLKESKNEGRSWEVHQHYVHPQKAFFVFHKTNKSELEIRTYLKNICEIDGAQKKKS